MRLSETRFQNTLVFLKHLEDEPINSFFKKTSINDFWKTAINRRCLLTGPRVLRSTKQLSAEKNRPHFA